MAEIFTLQTPENRNDHRKLSIIDESERYTPKPYGNSNGRKPEIYHLGSKDDSEQPFSPPIKSSRPPYSPPLKSSYPSSDDGAELYHLKAGDDDRDIHDRRPSPAFVINNRVSPTPNHNTHRQGPEMYYIQLGDDDNNNNNRIKSPPIIDNYQKKKFIDNIIHDDHEQQNITMYMIAATDQENFPPSSRIQQRTPSPPPIHPDKKKQTVSYDIIDDNNKFDIPNKHRPFPTALIEVSTNIRYVPLSQSKASESIQRSMLKYRFGGS